jgi:hypothetical protein
LGRAHKLAFENRNIVIESEICACFYCLKTFKSSEIVEWAKDKNAGTAICPYCGIDAVIADMSELPIIDLDFLKQMYQRYFN